MMFDHSIKVAQLYKKAAKLAETVYKGEESIKNGLYKVHYPNKKGLLSLVTRTLKHDNQLEFLLKRIKLLEKEPRFNVWLLKVLITELLWGAKHLSGNSKPIKTILAYEQVLKAHASDIHEDNTVSEKVSRPRFVRVNTILGSIEDAVGSFRDEGWRLVHAHTKDYSEFLHKAANLSENEFMLDMHVPSLLIFPPHTIFYAHSAYKRGLIVLQDKASCLPVRMLNPTEGSTVLDMCAAPGMKTSHLAAEMNNNGRIYAVDLSTDRLEILKTIMEKTGVTCVETINKDILKIRNSNCPGVEYILVDPSCSGSGIVDRIELTESEVKDGQRIQKLKGFQIMILKHALKAFPDARRVVYSTCSVYPEENEEVIAEVLSQITRFKIIDATKLLKAPWSNYVSEKQGKIAKLCLHSRPDKHLTNGFFVAVFERLKEGEVNEFFDPNTEFYKLNQEDEPVVSKNEENNSYTSPTGVKKNRKKKRSRKSGPIPDHKTDIEFANDGNMCTNEKQKSEKSRREIMQTTDEDAENRCHDLFTSPTAQGKRKNKTEKFEEQIHEATIDHKNENESINYSNTNAHKKRKKKSKSHSKAIEDDEGIGNGAVNKKNEKHQTETLNVLSENEDVSNENKKDLNDLIELEDVENVNEHTPADASMKKKKKKKNELKDNVQTEENRDQKEMHKSASPSGCRDTKQIVEEINENNELVNTSIDRDNVSTKKRKRSITCKTKSPKTGKRKDTNALTNTKVYTESPSKKKRKKDKYALLHEKVDEIHENAKEENSKRAREYCIEKGAQKKCKKIKQNSGTIDESNISENILTNRGEEERSIHEKLKSEAKENDSVNRSKKINKTSANLKPNLIAAIGSDTRESKETSKILEIMAMMMD